MIFVLLRCKPTEKVENYHIDTTLTQIIGDKKIYYFNDKNIASICQLNRRMEREGPETTYFHEPTGLIETIGTRKFDSCLINEFYHYFKSGELRTYKFYDGCGELKFKRLYLKKDDVLDKGDLFFHYSLKYPNKFKVGEVINKVYYLPSPPKISHRLFLVSNEERILLKNNSKLKYIEDVNFYNVTTKRGKSKISYQIEYYDSITNTITSSKIFNWNFIVE